MFALLLINASNLSAKASTMPNDKNVIYTENLSLNDPITKNLNAAKKQKDSTIVAPNSGGYTHSTYVVNYVKSSYLVDDVYAVLDEVYTPVGQNVTLSYSTIGTVSVTGNCSFEALESIKLSLGITGSLAFSYTVGRQFNIPPLGDYDVGRPVMRIKYIARLVNITEAKHYLFDYGEEIYYSTYDAWVYEPDMQYTAFQYRYIY